MMKSEGISCYIEGMGEGTRRIIKEMEMSSKKSIRKDHKGRFP